MKVGLVGYAQSGKSTLFCALTGLCPAAGPKGKPNLGVIKVPDPRLELLASIYRPRRLVPAEIVFIDVPGPRGKGHGLDRATLQALQEVDALALVLRGFEASVESPPDPALELLNFESELMLSDLVVVERRLERLAKERGSERQQAVLQRCHQALEAETSLRRLELLPEEEREISCFAFLSRRPLLAVLNTREADLGQDPPPGLTQVATDRGLELVSVCAKLEAEIAGLPKEEQGEFLRSMGLSEPASLRFIRAAYRLLDQVTFFTASDQEVRAWTVRRGTPAPRAAGRVHSDMERGFIRAEVMAFDEFVRAGSESRMRETGRLRVEGKDYVVADGDILHFRFAV